MKRDLSDRLFPRTRPQEPVYVERMSWFRYAFFIGTTAFFTLIFWFYLVMSLLRGTILTSVEGQVSLAGGILAPLICLLYLVRYLRSGYALTDEAIHYKSGYFFQNENTLPLREVKAVERVREERHLVKSMAHLQVKLKDGGTRLLLDVREPRRLLREIRARIAK
jgi:uncharacterized membrane protein YdbT with pleckstrin-like domain